jgi:sporulation protein YqfC
MPWQDIIVVTAHKIFIRSGFIEKGDNGVGKKDFVKRGLSAALALPKEIVLNLPLISLIGSEELMIENYKGVVEYSDEKIRINTSAGILVIEGKKLLLKQITSDNIAVTGRVKRLEFIK